MVANNIWRTWVNTLHRWGVENLIASLLEAVGPLGVLGVQVVYISQPIFNSFLPQNHMQALVKLLDDSNQRQAFIKMLREASKE